MTLMLTILGSGSSAGVPRPALGWGACDPNNPKNRRRRCSLLVEKTSNHGTTRIVIHMRKRIPIYFNQSTAKDIMARFSYCFISPEGSDYPPILTRHSIEAGGNQVISGKGGDVTMTAFLVQHGNIPALGYRIGNAAYTP